MAMAAPARVDVNPVGLTAASTVVWRQQDRVHVTVVVKATFAFEMETHVHSGALARRTLHGAYRLTTAEAQAIGAIPLQRAVVITATSGLDHWSWSSVGDTLLFEDDEHGAGGFVRGFWNLELPAAMALDPGRVTHVLASMGAILSNIVRIGGD